MSCPCLEPNKGEVRIRVAAIGLNRAEFEQIVEAHRYMESNQQNGKIIVTAP